MSLFGNFSLGSERYVADSPVSPDSAPPPNEVLPYQFNASRRTSVSAECAMPDDTETSKAYGRLASTGSSGGTSLTGLDCAAQLRASLRNIILFQDLSDDSLNVILSSLMCRREPSGTEILTQGDEGDYLYILESGTVEYYVDKEVQGSSGPGSCFGELALLYNAPRAATVRAVTDCTLWLLDRATFKQIMVRKRSDKREHSRAVLASIEIFAALPLAAQLKIADALQPVSFGPGEVVINEGDQGEDFYLVDEGEVSVTTHGKHLANLGPGSYFGEQALIYDNPRNATVTAKTTLKLERLSKNGFVRLLGPAVIDELRKRAPQ